MRTPRLKQCECGCGELVKHPKWSRFKPGCFWKGKKHSEEAKEGIRAALVGRKHTKETRNKMSKSRSGEKHHMFGKKFSTKSRQKMSASHTGKKLSKEHIDKIIAGNKGKKHSSETIAKLSGANASNWQGGIACEPYCSIWIDETFKEMIFERDNYECQNPLCWATSTRIMRHHIDYNKKNCDQWNIITVCGSCNSRANYNRGFWRRHYRRMMRNEEKKNESTRTSSQ